MASNSTPSVITHNLPAIARGSRDDARHLDRAAS